ncbi:MAG: energy transducer TonB [Marinilabiliales bacterium]|nr:MAG: energy transducer TonB [Marinilabiliales bacterium]
MNAKKHRKKNLERYKSIFFQAGLLMALVFVFFAFEWKSYDEVNNDLYGTDYVLVEEELPPVVPEKKKELPRETTELEIVKDDQVVKNDVNINVEDDPNKKVKKYTPIKDPDPIIIEPQPIYQVVEDMPEFPGGEESLFKYLSSNIKYPVMAKESGIQGTVHLTFVVEADGSISNVRTLRGIGGGCDEEAIRVVKSMPNWSPGNQQGRPVRVQFNLPVKFVLR